MKQDCIVVAPSLIPSPTGDGEGQPPDVTTLAKLYRAGELMPVFVHDAAHEAMRDLVRARTTSRCVLANARQHLRGFLLPYGRIYNGLRGWPRACRRWLTTVRFDVAAIGTAILGHDPLDGQTRGVVDGNVQVFPADAAVVLTMPEPRPAMRCPESG